MRHLVQQVFAFGVQLFDLFGYVRCRDLAAFCKRCDQTVNFLFDGQNGFRLRVIFNSRKLGGTVVDHVLQFMRVIVLQLAQVDVDRRIAVSEVAAAGADELAALLNFYAAHFERVAALGALEKACQPGVLSRIGAGKLCLV